MDSSTDDGRRSCGSHQSPGTLPLCARGCGFWGTVENQGLCSKCYKDYLKETMAKTAAATTIKKQVSEQSKIKIPTECETSKLVDALESARISETVAINPSVCTTPVVKKRCGLCNKKLGLLGFECRCGGTFCGMHRYPEKHPCKFDFKKAGKIIIAKENPVCKTDKIKDRI